MNAWKQLTALSWRVWIFLAVAVIGAGSVGWGIARITNAPGPQRGTIVRRPGNFKFINPILGCEIAPKEAFTELRPIRETIARSIERAVRDGRAAGASVYLRLLNSGRWTGVEEEDRYAPASLQKVIVMIGYLKAAQDNPTILSEKITYRAPTPGGAPEEGSVATALEAGTTYTVDELIRRMIVYSSNDALNLLLDHLTETTLPYVRDVYSDLNITFPERITNDALDFMSPKAYSLAFRVLYGSTYLSNEASERALELLSKTTFTEGLRVGVPPQILVAHKFGARTVQDANGQPIKELHDCGIVYYPGHPYLLCVMTRGATFGDLAAVIADFSRDAYEGVDRIFRSR